MDVHPKQVEYNKDEDAYKKLHGEYKSYLKDHK